MSQPAGRVGLFIGADGAERSAAERFASVARTFGLPWSADQRSLAGPGEPLTAADLERSAVAVGIGRGRLAPLLAERFPDAARVEFWEPEAVEREVMNLVARLLGGKRSDDAAPPPTPEPPTRKAATVRVGRETAGRRGKGVTTVWDLPLDEAGVRDLAAALKQRCGTGGTVKDGRIEIQGDHRDRVAVELEKMGYKVKRSGG
jgi:predicted translation initiation factor SUI1